MCVRHMSTYVCVCVWRGGGSSLGAAADVSVLNDHSACSVWEALALHKGVCVCVCVKRRGGLHSEAECSPQHHAGPKTPNYSPLFFFFSPPLFAVQRGVQQRVTELISKPAKHSAMQNEYLLIRYYGVCWNDSLFSTGEWKRPSPHNDETFFSSSLLSCQLTVAFPPPLTLILDILRSEVSHIWV